MITLSGHSDDLIEVEGDIREEFGASIKEDDPGELVAFSNGVVLRIKYRTCWRIDLVAGQGHVHIVPCPEDDEDNYSDVATITEPVDWVICGNVFVRARRTHLAPEEKAAIHASDCATCDAARAVVDEISAKWDPLDNWAEVDAPDGEGTLRDQFLEIAAGVLHQSQLPAVRPAMHVQFADLEAGR